MPQVSVILPNYNYARYMNERVRSILHQTMADFELFYLDDASKDESNAVVEAYRDDPRLHMTLYTENSGMVYKRWNDGAALATGDWLWFAGADDSAHPRFLQVLLDLARQHPTAALVHCSPLIMDAQGGLIELGAYGDKLPSSHLAQDHFAPGYEDVLRLMRINHLRTASAMLIRRDAFEAVGGFDARLWLAADWNLYCDILRRHDIAYTTKPLAYFRWHMNTVSNTAGDAIQMLEKCCIMARAYEWMRNDSRIAPEISTALLRRIKANVFDMFEWHECVVPEKARFAAQTLYKIVPDKRLLKCQARIQV